MKNQKPSELRKTSEQMLAYANNRMKSIFSFKKRGDSVTISDDRIRNSGSKRHFGSLTPVSGSNLNLLSAMNGESSDMSPGVIGNEVAPCNSVKLLLNKMKKSSTRVGIEPIKELGGDIMQCDEV